MSVATVSLASTMNCSMSSCEMVRSYSGMTILPSTYKIFASLRSIATPPFAERASFKIFVRRTAVSIISTRSGYFFTVSSSRS